jgi:hypothetical protein
MVLTPNDSTATPQAADEASWTFTDAERGVSRMLDRAQAQLEAPDDPRVVRIYRRLVDELEALIP